MELARLVRDPAQDDLALAVAEPPELAWKILGEALFERRERQLAQWASFELRRPSGKPRRCLGRRRSGKQRRQPGEETCREKRQRSAMKHVSDGAQYPPAPRRRGE